MKRLTYWFLVPLSAFILLSLRGADPSSEFNLPPEPVRLKSGPGVELIQVQCILCHSLDYITTQPPLTREVWTAEVEKMRKTFGAPIPDSLVNPIVDYLAKSYGPKID